MNLNCNKMQRFIVVAFCVIHPRKVFDGELDKILQINIIVETN